MESYRRCRYLALGWGDSILDREGGAAPPNAGIGGELFRLSPVTRLLAEEILLLSNVDD